jgi:hypothetical protein
MGFTLKCPAGALKTQFLEVPNIQREYFQGTFINSSFSLKQDWKRTGFTLKVPEGFASKNAVFRNALQ